MTSPPIQGQAYSPVQQEAWVVSLPWNWPRWDVSWCSWGVRPRHSTRWSRRRESQARWASIASRSTWPPSQVSPVPLAGLSTSWTPALRSVDAIVGNAGVQGRDRIQQSENGYELTFAVNVIANHVLVERLVPALSADAHVVIVGSGTHYGTFPTTSLVAAPVWADPATLARPGAALPSARPQPRPKPGSARIQRRSLR